MDEHPEARHVVEVLAKAGFVAYYAGGWVRDLLLQHPSDDIDIATNAPPETIQALFSHTVPVGIAFGIVIVLINDRQYEVATFRQDIDYKDGRRPTRVEFTTAIEDARRRDFTINGMFYDPLKDEILDFVGGKKDLEAKIVRSIGNPHLRIKEDRLRMIRAIRIACRFNFHIEKETGEAIRAHANELFPAVAVERIWQEFKKGHDFGKLRAMLIQLHEYELLGSIFPELKELALEEVTQRLKPLKDYPIQAPVIAFLLPLFPNASLKMQLELCKKFKLPNIDPQFVTFLYHAKELAFAQRAVERYEWAYFYANPFALISLQILSAHLDPERKVAFLHDHEERMKFLQQSIQRIKTHDPVLKSGHLLHVGIQPGVTMGKLLKEADRISINDQIHEADILLEILKTLPLWPH